MNMISRIRRAAKKKVLFLPHALRQISRYDRMISPEEVRNVVETGKIIEDYPEDERGHSCLMLGSGSGDRPIHVVCSPKEDYLAIITAYLPNLEIWEENLSRRRKR